MSEILCTIRMLINRLFHQVYRECVCVCVYVYVYLNGNVIIQIRILNYLWKIFPNSKILVEKSGLFNK